MAGTRSITVNPGSITLSVGSWYENLKATVDADSDSCKTVTWESKNPNIASVNASTGYVFAKSVGDTEIYAKTKDGKSDYCGVTVISTPVKITYLSLNQDSVNIQKGGTYEFTPTVSPDYATNKTLNWTSTNESVATVEDGVVTARNIGYTQIQATTTDDSHKYDCCDVYVTAATLVTSVEISPSILTLTAGGSHRLYPIIYPYDATNRSVRWSSDKPNIVSVNPEEGFVYAISPGTATIRATAQDGTGKYGECTVTVDGKIPVEDIEVSPKNLTLNVGETKELKATVCPSNATNKRVNWVSTKDNIVSVDYYTGKVTAKSAGEAKVSAVTDDGHLVDCCTVTVSQVLNYPDNLITNVSTKNAILKLKNIRDETVNAYLDGVINCDAMEKATQKIDYEINLVRADYIAVGTNPLSDYAYAILGGDKSSTIPYPFKRNLYYRSNNPFNGLDVMVVQRVLELYGYYEHDSDSLYGTWDQATQDAALNWLPLLSVVNGERVFDNASFHVLFQASNVSQRTYESMRLLQQFNLQHKQVQIECRNSLVLGGTIAKIEMPIKGGSITGRTGRADVVGKTIGGTYVWEVKHNSSSAITVGDAQVQRYIAASQTVPEQDAFYPENLKSQYELPLIAGPSIFTPTAIPWYEKYLLYKSYVSANPYRNALVVYEESDTIPDGYLYVEEPVAVEVPAPEASYAFDFTSVYNTLTNFGEAIVRGMQIDPQTGEVLVTVFLAGTICLLSLAVLATA